MAEKIPKQVSATAHIAGVHVAHSSCLLVWPVARKDRLSSRIWQTFGHGARNWLSLFTLLIPVVGPFIDYHYAQRQPHHGHIYVGDDTVQHDHPHRSQLHIHDEADGVVSVPAVHDGATQTGRGPALLLVLPSALFSLTTGLAQQLTPQLLPTHEFYPSPPEKPPRAMAHTITR